MGASPAASADPHISRLQALAPARPELTPGEPDLGAPSGAEPLIADAGTRIGWTALEGGRGAVALDYGIRFDVDLSQGSASYNAAPAIDEGLVLDSWERCVLPFALASAGDAVLHAAALTDGLSAVAIAGRSGTGKSTLRAELERFGYRGYADDALALAVGDSTPRATFLPFRPKSGRDRFAGPRVERPVADARELPLRAVVVLARDGRAALSRLEGAAGFKALLENSYTLAPAGGAPPATEELLAVAEGVPVFELRYPHTGEAEPGTVGALLSVLRGCGLWGGRGVLRDSRQAALTAVPMAARYVSLRWLGDRISPARMGRLALAPRRPRLPVPPPARPTAIARLRAASALFPPGSACVQRSLAVSRALADGGLEPEVVVGWNPELGEGHAWLELEGMRILDDALPDRSFTELWRCDHRGRIRPAVG
jgi:hypothetical protein